MKQTFLFLVYAYYLSQFLSVLLHYQDLVQIGFKPVDCFTVVATIGDKLLQSLCSMLYAIGGFYICDKRLFVLPVTLVHYNKLVRVRQAWHTQVRPSRYIVKVRCPR